MHRQVSFSNLDLDISEMLMSRRVRGPFPASWELVSFEFQSFDVRHLEKWVCENTHGRFGLVCSFPRANLYFENQNDAVLFRLQDGETACLETQKSL